MNEITIVNIALLKVGAAQVGGFDDGTVEAEVARALYPEVRDGLLAEHPWRFATSQVTLLPATAAPIGDWARAFLLPAETLRVLSCGTGGAALGLPYAIRGGYVLTSAETAIVVEVIQRPAVTDFPPHFRLALHARLAAEFALPLTESTDRWTGLRTLAEQELKRAKLIDAQQDTPRSIETATLISVR